MVDLVKEKIVLIEHIISFICTLLTIYFNSNFNIQYLAFMCMLQHVIKIIRIGGFGFEMNGSPLWFCNVHFFVNHFTNNILVIIGFFIIFYLYVAIKYPNHYAKYNKKMRPYVIIISVVYSAIFNLLALYEPIFLKYTEEEIASRHNCVTAYRYRLYQFILGSSVIEIGFIFASIYCAVYIIKEIFKSSRKISSISKKHYSEWIVIIFISSSITLLSLFNIIGDIEMGIKVENGEPEIIKLNTIYFVTATSGFLILIFSLTPKQIKYKLGMNVKEVSDHCFEYKLEKDENDNIEKYDRNLSIELNMNMNNLYNINDNNSETNNSKNNNNKKGDNHNNGEITSIEISSLNSKTSSNKSKNNSKEFNYWNVKEI